MTEAIWSSDPACPRLYEPRKPSMLATLRPAFGASLAISSSLCGTLLPLIPAAATALAGELARPAVPHWGTILQRCAAVAPEHRPESTEARQARQPRLMLLSSSRRPGP